MKKTVKWLCILVFVAFVVMQFFGPSLANPAVEPGGDITATNPPPASVALILHNACYDCHSYETKWPWYGHVAPVSWWLMEHVNDARDGLNFSEWPHDDPDTARKTLNRIVREVNSKRMPLPSYTWLHPDSRLTSAQRKELTDWAAKRAEALKD